jgi:two-component system nitrate/nitrite response regulator NarL
VQKTGGKAGVSSRQGLPGPRRIRVLLGHDHVVLREALRDVLTRRGEFDVIGETSTSEEATALCGSLQPDVLLLDAGLPGPPPDVTVGRIRSVAERTAVIVLGGVGSSDTARHFLRVGASGYLRRVTSLDSLCAAIRGAAPWHGQPSAPAQRGRAGAAGEDAGEALSPRESELLTLVAQALSNREIAVELGIAEGTVKRHLRNIFRKLNASSRLDAVNKAFAGSPNPSPGGGGRRSRPPPPPTSGVEPGPCLTPARALRTRQGPAPAAEQRERAASDGRNGPENPAVRLRRPSHDHPLLRSRSG